MRVGGGVAQSLINKRFNVICFYIDSDTHARTHTHIHTHTHTRARTHTHKHTYAHAHTHKHTHTHTHTCTHTHAHTHAHTHTHTHKHAHTLCLHLDRYVQNTNTTHTGFFSFFLSFFLFSTLSSFLCKIIGCSLLSKDVIVENSRFIKVGLIRRRSFLTSRALCPCLCWTVRPNNNS